MRIQRFEFASTDDFGNDGPAFERLEVDGEYVRYEDHLSQLAALREELAQRNSFEELYSAAIDERDAIQQRLADAERRNAELTQALERGKLWVELFRSWFGDYGVSAEDHQMIIRTLRSLPHPPNEFDAAINPKPETRLNATAMRSIDVSFPLFESDGVLDADGNFHITNKLKITINSSKPGAASHDE